MPFMKYENSSPSCALTFSNDVLGYCWEYARAVDAGRDPRCRGCEYYREELDKMTKTEELNRLMESTASVPSEPSGLRGMIDAFLGTRPTDNNAHPPCGWRQGLRLLATELDTQWDGALQDRQEAARLVLAAGAEEDEEEPAVTAENDARALAIFRDQAAERGIRGDLLDAVCVAYVRSWGG